MSSIIIWTIQLLLIPALSPLFVGLTRKMKAKLQNRQGANICQPYRDLWKLLHKDEVISNDASWIFRFAPFIIFAITLVIGACIPLFTTLIGGSHFISDLLVVVYLLALATFFLALGGLDTGGAFGGFGASREMLVSALAEGGLIFSILALSFIAQSTNLFSITDAVSTLSLSSFLPVILAFIGFGIAMLAETSRFPFDNPATHLELTMIHEAMIIEHSGKKLALLEWAAANKMMIFIALGSNLFFPWGVAHSAGFYAVISALIIFVLKASVFCAVIAIIESSIAKFRLFRLPDLLLISFILSLIAIGLII